MTKASVLAILKNDGGYVSGQKISESLGISRAAVNQAVKSLRADGCEIESTTNRGYRLVHSPDGLTTGDLLAILGAERMKSVVCLDTVGSTNSYLRETANGSPTGQTVVADSQTSGRGRLGRSFTSPAGCGIYMSMLLRPECTPAQASELTAWTAVAVRRAIASVCGVDAGIKWVNDLILNRKKICGILTEMSIEGESGSIQHIITGIGVNVNTAADNFSPELQSTAASIAAETGRVIPRAPLAAEMIRRLDEMAADFPHKRADYLKEYRAACVSVGSEVRVIRPAGIKTGAAVGVSDNFALTVRYDDGCVEEVSSGEVSVRGLYGYV